MNSNDRLDDRQVPISRERIAGWALAVLVALFSGTTAALEPEPAKERMAQDLLDCMAYYSHQSKANERDGFEASRYTRAADSALILAQVYLADSKKLEPMTALSQAEISRVALDRGGAWLMLNYAYPCKTWLENPAARMQYWLDKR